MSWNALGENPVPGEVDAVLRVASTLGGVCDQADLITRRLRVLDGGTGPQVWRGEAADAFRGLLEKMGPDLIKLSTSHYQAQQALRAYAGSLGAAQSQARQAETDAERASADKAAADTRRQQAASDAAGQDATARAAQLRIAQARAQQLAAPLDPVYQASMQQYQQQVGAQQANARAAAANARSRAAGEQAASDAAVARLTAAGKLAHQASMLRDDAARTATRAIDAAAASGLAHRNVFERAWNTLNRELRDIVTSPEFASWMNILSDVGEIVGDIGTVLALVPGLQEVGAGLILAGAALKGVAFLGTLLSGLYGGASTGQVLGRGLDFGLSLLGGLKALKAKDVAKAKGPITTLAGEIKRSIWYDNGRLATGEYRKIAAAPKLTGQTVKILGKVGVSPSTAFRLKTGYDAVKLGEKAWSAGTALGKDAVTLTRDITQFHDPSEQRTYTEEAPEAARTGTSTLVDVIAEGTGNEGTASTIVGEVAGIGAEKVTKEFVR